LVFEQIQIKNLKLTSAELSPECLRWFNIYHLHSSGGGEPEELSVLNSRLQLGGNSTTEGTRASNRSNDEIELYRQIYAQSWHHAVWDSIPAYRLNSEDVQEYLEGRFGHFNFHTHVRILAPFSFDCMTRSHLLTNSCS
jgi:hypothetical protein